MIRKPTKKSKIKLSDLANIQSLERRVLLSITAPGPDGTVIIDESTATSAVTVTVTFDAGNNQYDFNDNGTIDAFAASSVETVQITTGLGDDLIQVETALPGTIDGSARADGIDCGAGDDTVICSTGREVVFGDAGADSIVGAGSFGDTIHGNGGTDTILGTGGNDLLDGGGGSDSIDGGSGGSDQLFGDGGNDTLTSGISNGADTMFGGTGFDSLNGGTGGYCYLAGGTNADTIFGGTGSNETLIGGHGRDVLVAGGEGLLTLTGNSPASPVSTTDSLLGGKGRDTVIGSTGFDSLTGGGGPDVFYANSGSNTLEDFTPAQGDLQPVQDAYATGTTPDVNINISLKIIVNGTTVAIPSTAGSFPSIVSVAQVTSVAGDGTATVNFSTPGQRTFLLGDFFNQWGVSFNGRGVGQYSSLGSGASITMAVTPQGGSATANTSFADYAVQAGDSIVITVVDPGA
jgi:Ca2+-binding RTX toxin-like protein